MRYRRPERRYVGGSHRLYWDPPICRCPYLVTAEQPHEGTCPESIEQRRRLHAGRGGTRP